MTIHLWRFISYVRKYFIVVGSQCSPPSLLFIFLFPLVVNSKIEELGEALKNHYHIEEFTSVSFPAQVSLM